MNTSENNSIPKSRGFFVNSAPQPLVVLPNGAEPISLGSGIITSLLGEGGGAIVYEIWNERLGIKRAAKLLKPNTETSRDRFESEIKITALLRHPNIIEIHSVGEWRGLPYIEMEKLDGFTLEKLIKTRGALPLEMACAIGIIILRALTFTHNHKYVLNGKKHCGILHRDLKPANIMLCYNGTVKLMDFGIARPIGAPKQTIEGSFSGSLPYVAPEQLLGETIDERADIFSFGCILYEMITGKETFGEKILTRLVADRSKNNFIPLAYYGIKMPRKLVRLVGICLIQEKNRRMQNAAAALVQLEKIFQHMTSTSPEEVIKLFVNSSFEQKQKIRLKKSPYIVQRIIAVCVIIATLAALCLYFVELRKQHVFDRRTPPAPLVVPGTAVTTLPAPAAMPEKEVSLRAAAPHTSYSSSNSKKSAAVKKNVRAIYPAPKAAAPASASADTALTRLTLQYGTSNLSEIFIHEIEKGNAQSGLSLWTKLPESSQRENRMLLYKLRALKTIGANAELALFLKTVPINDAEYYFALAQHYFSHNRIDLALNALARVGTLPAEMADKNDLERMTACLTARCRYKTFTQVSSEQNRQTALESWGNVKYMYQKNQTDECYRDANRNIRLLSNTQATTP